MQPRVDSNHGEYFGNLGIPFLTKLWTMAWYAFRTLLTYLHGTNACFPSILVWLDYQMPPFTFIENWFVWKWWYTFTQKITVPICSLYGIFTNIYPINDPNVGKYTIHGASGVYKNGTLMNNRYTFLMNQRISGCSTHNFHSQGKRHGWPEVKERPLPCPRRRRCLKPRNVGLLDASMLLQVLVFPHWKTNMWGIYRESIGNL